MKEKIKKIKSGKHYKYKNIDIIKDFVSEEWYTQYLWSITVPEYSFGSWQPNKKIGFKTIKEAAEFIDGNTYKELMGLNAELLSESYVW